jgi:hypothetical protein
MRRNPVVAIFLLVAVVLATVWGFVTVLGQRFRSGEVYARFSTLRSDPLGAKALYEALDRLPDIQCERNLRPLYKLEGAKGRTLVLLHMDADDFTNREVDAKQVQSFAVAGGRVIITLDGQGNRLMEDIEDGRRDAVKERRAKEEAERQKKKGKPADAKPDSKDKKDDSEDEDDEDPLSKDDERPRQKRPPSVARTFGVRVKMQPYVQHADALDGLEWRGSLPLEKDQFPQWHSNSYFEFVDWDAKKKAFNPASGPSKWTVHATKNGNPMVIERSIGQGSLVVLSDSYFASNEALFKEAKPAFLAWLMGHADTIIFDETHLGTGENPGIMTLARRYRLHGMFIGALVLFGLFIWKNTMSLVPPDREEAVDDVVTGHGATAGLVSLLKRGIPSANLLNRSFEIWLRSHPPRSAAVSARLQQAQDIVAAETGKSRWKRDPAATYARICAVIHPPRR